MPIKKKHFTRIKDTVHFRLHKNLFIIFVIAVCTLASFRETKADFGEVFNNVDLMLIFLQRMVNLDFGYLPNLVHPLIKTLKMPILGTITGDLLAIPFSFLATSYYQKRFYYNNYPFFIKYHSHHS